MSYINSREDFPSLFTSLHYKIGIELGSFHGEFAKHILNNWNGKLICVDLFDRDDNYDINKPTGYYSSFEKKLILPTFNENLKSVSNRLLTIQSDTVNAAQFFPDEYFDFIYIDADHRYEAAIKDIQTWYPKLKKHGFFAGHDFLPGFDYSQKNNKIYFQNTSTYIGDFGVNSAIKEFTESNNIQYFTTHEPYWKSWYWFKQ